MKSSILQSEILEQPEIVQRMLEAEGENVSRLAVQLRGEFRYVIIAARGTSDNAARYAQYLFGAENRLPVALATPSLFTLYKSAPDLTGALVIGISQSGQSPDIVSVLNEGQRQGRPTLAITNDPDSALARVATYHIHLHAGAEKSVAATKTYTSSLAAMALLSASLAGDDERLKQLKDLPKWMDLALQGLSRVLKRVERYRYMQHCAVIGRGFNYATAFEIALKIKELTRIVAEPYSSADFRHGPIAMVRDGFPVLLVAPHGATHADVSVLVKDLQQRDGELLIISNNPELLESAHLALEIPSGIPEHLSPMVAVLPGQLFSLALTQAKGYDPDHPAGITKVTETL